MSIPWERATRAKRDRAEHVGDGDDHCYDEDGDMKSGMSARVGGSPSFGGKNAGSLSDSQPRSDSATPLDGSDYRRRAEQTRLAV
jgi:hypothetical protein